MNTGRIVVSKVQPFMWITPIQNQRFNRNILLFSPTQTTYQTNVSVWNLLIHFIIFSQRVTAWVDLKISWQNFLVSTLSDLFQRLVWLVFIFLLDLGTLIMSFEPVINWNLFWQLNLLTVRWGIVNLHLVYWLVTCPSFLLP